MQSTARDDMPGDERDPGKERGPRLQASAASVRAQVADQARAHLRRGAAQAGEQLVTGAGALRQSSDRLEEHGQQGLARQFTTIAARVERAGQWLRDGNEDRILAAAEDFGRRNPWTAASVGIAVGFALSRLLTASSERRYATRGQGYAGARIPASRPTGTGHAGATGSGGGEPELSRTVPPGPGVGSATAGAAGAAWGP